MKRLDGTPFGFICSLALHSIVILLGLWGLPFWSRLPSEPPRPIPIDVVTVDQISQAPRPKPKPEKKPLPTPPEEKPVEKPVEKPEPEKPEPLIQAEEKNPPQLPQEKPQVEDKNPSEVPKLEKPQPEKKPEKKKEKTEKKKEPQKEKSKKEDAKKKQKKEFLSVLKNLETSAEENVSDFLEPDLTSESNNAADKISDRLTISEMDLIKRQLTECWNVPAGVKDAKDLVIVLGLAMNRDGTVKEASVISGKSSTGHPFYRVGVESALRAVRNPHCIPLKLPPDRYDAWKAFTFTFTPQDMN